MPNNSFKPKTTSLRQKHGGKACHVFTSATRFGLTQALGINIGVLVYGLTIFNLLIVAFGLSYIIWPNMFRRWIRTRSSIAQTSLSPKGYVIFMRSLGVILIVIGLYPAISSQLPAS